MTGAGQGADERTVRAVLEQLRDHIAVGAIDWHQAQTAVENALTFHASLLLEVEGLKAALSSIERYGLDTMSGPADEVADLAQWIRDGVREMVHRARAALSPASGGV